MWIMWKISKITLQGDLRFNELSLKYPIFVQTLNLFFHSHIKSFCVWNFRTWRGNFLWSNWEVYLLWKSLMKITNHSLKFYYYFHYKLKAIIHKKRRISFHWNWQRDVKLLTMRNFIYFFPFITFSMLSLLSEI